jgi:hypothetical protein
LLLSLLHDQGIINICIPFIDATNGKLTIKVILAKKLPLHTTSTLALSTLSGLPMFFPFLVYSYFIVHLMR